MDFLKLLGGPLKNMGMSALKSAGSSLGSGLSKFFAGDPAREQRFQKYTSGQESILDQLLQQGMGETDFGGIEQLAKKRFEEETVPSLAERFTAMGGGKRSSAFQSALGRSGADLGAQLSALRPQFGMQKLMMGLQPRF